MRIFLISYSIVFLCAINLGYANNTGNDCPEKPIIKGKTIYCVGETPEKIQVEERVKGLSYNWYGDPAKNKIISTGSEFQITSTSSRTLYVTALGLCESESTEVNIVIQPKPKVEFVVDQVEGCSPLNLKFTDLSKLGGDTTATWHWDFDDKAGAGVRNPVHSYNAPGIYKPELTITYGNGCFDNYKMDQIEVWESPEVEFSYEIMDNNIYLVNLSEKGRDYYWEIPGDKTFEEWEPVISLDENDISNIRLSVTGERGCVSTVKHEIDIRLFDENVFEIINEELQIYPNPSSNGMIYLDFNHFAGRKDIHIKVYNLIGKEIYTDVIDVPIISRYDLNLSAQPYGAYFLNLYANDFKLTRRIAIDK